MSEIQTVCGIIVGMLCCGIVLFWWYLRHSESRKRELERLVRLRTLELQSMNTSLLQANTEIEQHIQTVSEQAWEIATINTQLQARNNELEALNRERNEFLGIAAHDLKNPLTTIVLSTELLKSNIAHMPEERVHERLRQIESTAMRMRTIISDLLDMNALESGKLTLRMDACDAVMLTEEVLAEYQERAAEKAISLELRYDAALMEQSYIYADFAKAREVVENIVSNAVKYSPLGKQVLVSLTSDLHTVKIAVKDEGPGLTEQDKAQLFERFTRLSAVPTGGEHSSGLGLSIAKKLVEAMNGKIWCESEAGRVLPTGATFIVEFPCAATLKAASTQHTKAFAYTIFPSDAF